MKFYLSGPMSGYEDLNRPEFARYTKALRDLGHAVVSPAELQDQGTYEANIAMDIRVILECEAVAVMPGWEKSRGCFIEVTVADGIGLALYEVDELIGRNTPVAEPLEITLGGWEDADDVEETVLQEADRIVSSDRGADYGHPLDDFTKTAQMWSAIFGVRVDAAQVPLAMIAVKISRELNSRKRDNLVDIAGYAKTLDMVHERRDEFEAVLGAEYQALASEYQS